MDIRVQPTRGKLLSFVPDIKKLPLQYKIMDLYDAIHDMRKLSEKNSPFEFTYMSCDMTRAKSQGVIHVNHGRLLSRERSVDHKDAEFVERYINLDTMEVRHFYQPLLMTFNGIKVTLQ